jgi:hypothetical protein
MKKHFNTLLIIILCLFTFNCKKVETSSNTPNCIKSKIREILKSSPSNPPTKVWKYQYNGETVYYFPAKCCDISSELYNEKCQLICRPDGGITGGGDGKCADFFTKRTNEEVVWIDNRTP